MLYKCALWRLLARRLVFPCFNRLRFRGRTAYQRIQIWDVKPQLDELVGVQGVGWSNHVCMEAEQIVVLDSNKVVIVGLLEIQTLTSHAFHSKGHRHFADRSLLFVRELGILWSKLASLVSCHCDAGTRPPQHVAAFSLSTVML